MGEGVTLNIDPRFSQNKPWWESVEWAMTSGIEAPVEWSENAVNIVKSKYLKPHETSVRQLITRVVDTITRWGIEQRYFGSDDGGVFANELGYIFVNQMAAFNSPVWFNVGAEEKPQCSACFILNVDDSMDSILEWYRQEAMLFKYGSGAGVNISKLRGKNEPLSGGGKASGPLSFMTAADSIGGIIKSGGKTRRAAKLVVMDISHPDIQDFIQCKAREEQKARVLEAAGYSGGIDGEATGTVAYQNSNHSVRITDVFMDAIHNDRKWQTHYVKSGEMCEEIPARDLLREIATAIHVCGDPGIQFHDTVNRWHTCPESGVITGSNPCSEFMFLDNTACNLASIRLTKFWSLEKAFDYEAFRHVIKIMVIAQDIIVDKASYPTPTIAENSHKFRPIGLGFTDLGALLMRQGIPYASTEAQMAASWIASFMTAVAYETSVMLAAHLGPFPEYEKNSKAMLDVIEMHRKRSPSNSNARLIWDGVVVDAWRDGVRNAQVTLLAPTGTISFMMDCDTTGIEPEYSLVRQKRLVDGPTMTIVNKSIEPALHNLSVPPGHIPAILTQIESTGNVDKCLLLSEAQRKVFECAIPTTPDGPCISSEAHLKMMAAVQPHISGAISKTVNCPHNTTVEQIEQLIVRAWELELKSVTIYRDGSKTAQPLITGNINDKGATNEPNRPQDGPRIEEFTLILQPQRVKLPTDCKSDRHRFEFGSIKGYIHTGVDDDGYVREIFVRVAKAGSTLSGLIDALSIVVSMALQYGVPLEDMVRKLSHMRFEPAGFTDNPEIKVAKSLVDYIFRYLGIRYLNDEQRHSNGIVSEIWEPEPERIEESGQGTVTTDAPMCTECGGQMVRNGTCYTCPECGNTTGCG